jgi:hypothetical protein
MKTILETRYQYYAKDGIKWTKWFPISSKSIREKWQLKGKLKNEYREIEVK